MPHACPHCQIVANAAQGRCADLIASWDQCLVVLAPDQGCAGWVMLVLKEHAEHLDRLDPARQAQVHAELMRAGALLRRVLGAPRINYACLGNVVSHVHWHVIPRGLPGDPDPRSAPWAWASDVMRGSLSADQRAEMVGRLRAGAI